MIDVRDYKSGRAAKISYCTSEFGLRVHEPAAESDPVFCCEHNCCVRATVVGIRNTSIEAKRALRTPCLRCLRWFVKTILAAGVIVQNIAASAICVCSEVWSRLRLDSIATYIENWDFVWRGRVAKIARLLVVSTAEIDWLPPYRYDCPMTVLLGSSARPELQRRHNFSMDD